MRKSLCILCLLFLAVVSGFAAEYYVGKTIDDIHVVQLKNNEAYVLYEKDNEFECLYQDASENLQKVDLFAEYAAIEKKGLKIDTLIVPSVVFMGFKDDVFGIYYTFFSNEKFCDIKFEPLYLDGYADITNIKASFSFGRYYDYSFTIGDKLYICRFKSMDDILENIFSVDNTGNVVSDYSFIYKNNDIYGYCLYENDNSFSLFEINENDLFIEKQNVTNLREVNLHDSFRSSVYCSYISDESRCYVRFDENSVTNLFELAVNENVPNIIYDNINEYNKILLNENSLTIDDNNLTHFFYKELHILPYSKNILMILYKDLEDDWNFVETDFSRTSIRNLKLEKENFFSTIGYSDKKNSIYLTFVNTLKNTLSYLYIMPEKEYETLTLDLTPAKKDIISIDVIKNRKIILNSIDSSYIIQSNNEIYELDRYSLIDFTEEDTDYLFCAIFTDNQFIKTFSLKEEDL